VKIAKIAALASVVVAACGFCICASAQPPQQTEAVAPFLGRWDLTLKSPDQEYPSWIEISEKDSGVAARFTGRWGNARPLPKIDVQGKQITFVSPKEEESSSADLTFKGTLNGEQLSGTLNGPDGKEWSWTGVRAPSLKRPSNPQWEKPIDLFNGRDLSGWHESKAGPPDWTVKDGNLTTPGNGPELISDDKFQDFKLHIEFKCDKDSNSGVYLRGRYEVQIETDSVAEPASHHTGGVYGFIAPSPELPRSPDVWQSFDITLVGRRVMVIQNGQTVIDNQEIPGLTGGAVDSHEADPGPIYLQGSEKGHVLFRKISIARER
jgi:hypothetical protein